MKMILMGTGTSHGVPVIGCTCPICTSSDIHDKRNRCSAFISSPTNIVIDTGPEFRIQAIKNSITKIEAVLITHSHADHLNGLDDVRIFSHTKAIDPYSTRAQETKGKGLPIYTNSNTITDIKNRFDYIFTPVKEGGGKPKIQLIDVSLFKPGYEIKVGKLRVIHIPILHGTLNDCGWLLCEDINNERKSIAYLTDCSYICEQSLNLIKEKCGTLCHLVIDGLRVEPHSTHFSFRQAMAIADYLQADYSWITHITHDMSHEDIKKYINQQLKDFPNLKRIKDTLKGDIQPAYDGLVLET